MSSDNDNAYFAHQEAPLPIRGTEGVVVNFGKCCYPIPGDPIIGIMTSGKGLVIHRDTCRNIDRKNILKDKWIAVSWSDHPEQDFTVGIRAQTENQRGVLANLASRIADENSNIENISFEDNDDATTTLNFLIGVKDRIHLARIMRILRASPYVFKVSRIRA